MKWKSPNWHLRIQLIYLHMLLHSMDSTLTDRRKDYLTHWLFMRLQVFWNDDTIMLLVLLLSDSIYWCSLRFTFVCKIHLAIVAILYILCTLFLTISNGLEGFPEFFFCLLCWSTGRLWYSLDILPAWGKCAQGFREFYICFIENNNVRKHVMVYSFCMPSSIRWSDLRSLSTWTVNYWDY